MQRASKSSRERFIAELVAARLHVGPPIGAGYLADWGGKMMRLGATYGRLQEAQCNGDWPADNGQRKVEYCGGNEDAGCGCLWVPSTLKGKDKRCPDCRATAKIADLCEELGGVDFVRQGDPRGHTVKLHIGEAVIGVPTS